MEWKTMGMGLRTVVLTLAALSFLLGACGNDPGEEVPDVSGIEVEVEIRRFEQDLFRLDTNDLAEGLAELEAAYPRFAPIYFGPILGADNPGVAPEGRVDYVRGFLGHPAVRRLYDTTQIVFPSMEPYHDAFRSAFRFWRYYFPDQPVPEVTTFLSEFTVAAFVYEGNRLGVGLDLFLGNTFPYRAVDPLNPQFSRYMTRTFTPEHLVAKALQPLVEDVVLENAVMRQDAAGDRLLDLMIRNGKKLYVLDRLLPNTPDSILLEVTGPQTEWLYANERDIWAYFLQEDLLYSSTWQDIRKYVEYSPSSPGMPAEAPGRTGNFTGWRIVQAYMQRNPGLSLPELLRQGDAQAILDGARYRPR